MKKYAASLFLTGAAFACGWFGSQRFHKFVAVPTGNARLEVPHGCEPRLWMNGVELDCKSGATIIYYANKLERKSP